MYKSFVALALVAGLDLSGGTGVASAAPTTSVSAVETPMRLDTSILVTAKTSQCPSKGVIAKSAGVPNSDVKLQARSIAPGEITCNYDILKGSAVEVVVVAWGSALKGVAAAGMCKELTAPGVGITSCVTGVRNKVTYVVGVGGKLPVSAKSLLKAL